MLLEVIEHIMTHQCFPAEFLGDSMEHEKKRWMAPTPTLKMHRTGLALTPVLVKISRLASARNIHTL